MKKKSYWLSISVFVLILIWTVYYYAMQYTGGFADLKDSIVCGIVGLICIVFRVNLSRIFTAKYPPPSQRHTEQEI